MFKKACVIFVIVLGLTTGTAIYQNNPGNILNKLDVRDSRSTLKHLRYKIYLFGILPVGEAVLREKAMEKYGGNNLFRLSAEAKSCGFAAKVYPFKANVDSFADIKTMLPVIFTQNIKTKDKEIIKEVRYDQVNNTMEIAGERRKILSETYEPLSALSKLMSLKLSGLSGFDLNINTNQKNYALMGDIAHQDIKTKSGTVRIYKLRGKIFRRDKNPYHKSRVEFVMLGEKGNIPVFIKVFASGVLLTARLTEIN